MDLSGATVTELKNELLSRSSTVGDFTTVYALLAIVTGLGYERDQATPTFNAAITGRRRIDVLTAARESLEKP